ncbi:MAG: putative ATP-dependent helicase DinG [Firmicutes bacterium]|nr:putative ATP-dependent helicase DinG [Bacillota bacterium]MBT9157414.1 putative ATP-dependent helicase DinG [Bacillota bacterium]
MDRSSIFSVVDVETTGLSAERDRVTEVAIVHVQADKIFRTYATLVNPGRPIPPFIQQMTGITDAMVAGAPTFAEVAQIISANLAGTVFVAHNVRFDHGFLKAEFARANHAFPPLTLVDTVALARQGLRGLPNYRLETLCEHLGLVAGRHRALGDATVAAHLLIKLLGA